MNITLMKSAIAYILSSFFVQGIAFISQILLMRWFNLTEYGKYALAFEVFAICNLVINGAFRNFYLKAIRFGSSSSSLISYQLVYGSFWCLVSVITISLIFKLDYQISLVMCMSMVLSSIFLPVSMEFLAKGYKWRLITRDILNSGFVLVISYCLILHGIEKSGAFIVCILISQVIVNFIVFVRFVKIKDFFDFKKNNKIGFSIIPFFGVFIVNTIYNKLGVSYVNLTVGIESVAIYLAAFKFITPFYAIQTALISAIMPKFTTEAKFEFNKRFFVFFALPGGVSSLFLFLAFPLIVGLFGLEKYDGLYNIIKFSSPVIFVVFLYGALSNYIAVNGGQRYIITTNALGIFIYVIMLGVCRFFLGNSYILIFSISFFVITECCVCILYYTRLKKENRISKLFLLSPILVITYEFFQILSI